MSRKIVFSILLALVVSALPFSVDAAKKERRSVVRLETTAGNIRIALSDLTPVHRDNFLILVEKGYYDGVLFHRVIEDFMIQTGDPDSKGAPKDSLLGNGGPGYTLPAEIVFPELFHVRGSVAAAREGDDVNPERASSGCQFYIVTGRKFSESQLLNMEGQKNNNRIDEIFNELARKHMKEIYKMRKANDEAGLMALQDSLEAEATAQYKKEEKFKFTPEQIAAYTTVGGAPHLDGAYTVFGQVLEGMETVEKIEGTKTGKADRPVENVRILKMSVVE